MNTMLEIALWTLTIISWLGVVVIFGLLGITVATAIAIIGAALRSALRRNL